MESALPGDARYVEGGRVTEGGLLALRSRMPYADLSDLERDRRLGSVSDLFTVDLLFRYIEWKLEGGPSPDGARSTVLEPSSAIRP